MSVVDWLAALLGVVCVALGAARNVGTFPTGIASVTLVGWVVAHQHLYSDALLQAFFVAANGYGWINWSRSERATGAVAVDTLAAGERAAWLVLWAAATLGWGAAMHRWTDAAYPWWDAGIAVASVIAQWLMAKRAWENWAIWIAVDLASIPLYAAKQLWALAALYLVYGALSIWGLRDWRRVTRPVARATA